MFKEVVMKKWFGLMCASVLGGNIVQAQVEAVENPVIEEDLPYQVDAISFAAVNSPLSRLDVFIQVSYEDLTFIRKEEKYYASYEMSVILYDSAGRLVNEKQWTENINAASFDESVSPQTHSLTQRVFEVVPGKYSINTILRDGETRFSKRLVREITVPDFAHQPFALSDIMLVRKLSTDGDRTSIVPSVSANVGNLTDGFHLFFESYNNITQDSFLLRATVFNEKREIKLTVDTVQWLATGRSQVFMKIDNTPLSLGNYTVYVQAFPLMKDTSLDPPPLSTTSRLFMVRWRGLPKGVDDLELAIEQMQYITKEKELDHIKAGATTEERQKRFLEFWKSKDTNPNTPRNEKMEEYYAKVDYANKHFKNYSEGWRTDMGMVYIIFGAPNNVDRHPFDIDSKPYEVWSYYELNHQFVFVDQNGFGDYRLTTPIWEVWQRTKD